MSSDDGAPVRLRSDMNDAVMAHWRARGIKITESEATDSAIARLPLFLGIGRSVDATPRGLIVGRHLVRPSVRRLHHLLRASEGRAGQLTYLADQAAVHAASRHGFDPVLYRAYRDIFPPRDKHTDGVAAFGHDSGHDSGDRWYADLVIYAPGRLPGGEPSRSTGHWNSPGQLEIFQTLTGRTLMLVAERATGHRLCVGYQICETGDIAVIPPGAWHMTYCLGGPAAVFNIYADSPLLATGHSSRAAALDEELKYRTLPPAPIAMRRTAAGLRLIGTSDVVWTAPRKLTAPQWLHDHVPPDASLGAFYLHATARTLANLEHAAATTGSDHRRHG